MPEEPVVQLPGIEGSPDAQTPEQATGSQEEMPAWAQKIVDENARLVNEVRTAQGQANRASQESAQLRGQLSTLLTTMQARDGGSRAEASADLLEDLKDLDQSDPGVRKLTSTLSKMIRAFGQEIGTVKQTLGQLDGHRQAQQLTDQEQGIRDHNATELTKFAKRLKIEITPQLTQQIRNLPTNVMWDKGCDLIEAERDKASGAEKRDEAKKTGAFGEDRTPSGSGGINKAKLRAEDLKTMSPEQYMKLGLTDEEEALILNRR